MDWAKAKDIIIVVLIILNVLLFGFILIKSQKYYVSEKEKKLAETVFERENVFVNCDLPKNFSPMSNMMLKKNNYDVLKLKNIFFDSDKVNQTIEFDNRILYTDDGRKMTISGGKVVYSESLSKEDDQDKIISNVINKISKNYCVMNKYRDDYIDGERVVFYNQMFNGYIIFNNYVSFVFNDSDKYIIEFMYSDPMGFQNGRMEIHSPNEAVYAFCSEIKKVYDNEKYVISEIDLGYYFESSDGFYESTHELEPYYRIFIENIENPFFVNAIDNSFIYEMQ